MHALGNRYFGTLLLIGATLSLVFAGGAVAPLSPPSPPPEAPDAYEPPPEASPPPRAPLAVALSRGDVHAAAKAVLEPREAMVQLRDGQRFTGQLVERTPERVVLQIAGINTTIRDELIDRVVILPSVHDRYLSMRAAIEADDVEQLLRLVEWLRTREQWDLALHELDEVLQAQPHHPDARRLKLLVTSQRDLAERSRRRAEEAERRRAEGEDAEESPSTRPSTPRPTVPRPTPDFPTLTEDQINLIKVYEIDLAAPPRLVIERATITRLITEYGDDRALPQTREGKAAIYRMNPVRVLELMFRARARDLYGEVKVIDQPRTMRQFRDSVHRSWIINSCATNRCHGGTEAGRLVLNNRRAGSDPTVYTNFLILERFRLANGKPLIDYDEPETSPLLHLGLPRDASRFPHPPVLGPAGRGDLWRPVFRSTSDRRFTDATDWIRAMYRPRPEYPIEYTPPEGEEAAPPIER